MAEFSLATVPYVNAYPLIFGLEEAFGSSVRLIPAVPSMLPALLDSGEAQAAVVSSIEAVQRPNRVWISDLCIGSDGPVESVRLFSQVPFHKIKRVALDQSSMTSNLLAMILLEELFGVKPEAFPLPPVQSEMLAQADACVLIGDIGMMAPSEGLEVLDMGQGWKDLTGLPFVWAGWIGPPGYDPALPGLLEKAYELTGLGADPSDWPSAPPLTPCPLSPFGGEGVAGPPGQDPFLPGQLKKTHELPGLGADPADWPSAPLTPCPLSPFGGEGVVRLPGQDPSLPGLLEMAHDLTGLGADPSDWPSPPLTPCPLSPFGGEGDFLARAEAESGWSRERLDRYLNSTMIYRLSGRMRQGRDEFWARAQERWTATSP